ncbi:MULTISPECIES: hypothetical protein [Halomonas]|uniref:Lipoprotein n=1 Tax=Halomonas halophila TaxID=29573 RepID=A0ABQ0U787_9GAMM|nr:MULTISPECIES: hypothetical protein [Halomonas]MDR5890618.1 hypothetical protein [Halomonas salina]RAH38061.1 hypothetical protein C9J49_006415 [Halomonas sp. SL1]WJY06019.1 hypothetical protein QWG60_09875 [Halomonas halophila]GEK74343.1 hypothetical protein HHA04nite_28870 [Halomonas halophila]
MSFRPLTLATLLLAALFLAGCSYTPARIDPEPLLEIGGHHDRDYHRHGGGFCPPGQAKKGRC